MRRALRGKLVWALCAGLGLVLAVAVRPAQAVDATPPLPTPVLQQRYEALIHEFRCMQCQDEALADSPVDLAAEMRMQVHDLVLRGESERQVRAYMVSRYGEFVLFKPPFNWRYAWLWLAPFVLLVVGALVGWRVLAARRRLVDADDSIVPDESDPDRWADGSAGPNQAESPDSSELARRAASLES